MLLPITYSILVFITKQTWHHEQLFQENTGIEKLIPHFWWGFYVYPLSVILTKHNIKETSSKHNIWDPFYILPNLRINVVVKEQNIQFQVKKSILTLTPIICTRMYNNGDINSPQSYFLWESTKKQKYLPYLQQLTHWYWWEIINIKK